MEFNPKARELIEEALEGGGLGPGDQAIVRGYLSSVDRLVYNAYMDLASSEIGVPLARVAMMKYLKEDLANRRDDFEFCKTMRAYVPTYRRVFNEEGGTSSI